MSGPYALLNGIVFDGTGAAPQNTGVLVEHGRIAAVGEFETPETAFDCAGLAIAPGFIDGHSHSDLQALEGLPEKVRQGVTTEVVGNCGFSTYPLAPGLHAFANGILRGGDGWGWPSAAAYLESARAANTNIVSLAGHGSLRIACAGNRLGPLTASEMDRMEGLLEDALSGGACGLSTGLMYAPGSSAPVEELEALCRIVARRGKIHTTHMRDYSGRLVDAVEEQLAIARRTGCRLQISHFQSVGQRFRPQQRIALDRIETARSEGVDVAFDCYPYVAGSTVLTQLLPQWVLDGGNDALLARLRGPERPRIAEETDTGLAQTWSDIFIAAAPNGADLVGRNIEQVAAERRCRPVDAALDVLLEQEGAVNILEFNQSESNLRETLSHPLSNVISDGFYVNGRPHPRLGGTFPHLLGDIVRNRGWLALPEAVRKITDAPARRFGLRDRGRIAPGYAADIVVFDPAAIASPATYQDPELPPVGIRAVFRDGTWGGPPGPRRTPTSGSLPGRSDVLDGIALPRRAPGANRAVRP